MYRMVRSSEDHELFVTCVVFVGNVTEMVDVSFAVEVDRGIVVDVTCYVLGYCFVEIPIYSTVQSSD